jgi:fructose/tagatose bisphosphate aldolase
MALPFSILHSKTPFFGHICLDHKPLDLHKQGLQYPMVIHGLVPSQTRKINQTIDTKLEKLNQTSNSYYCRARTFSAKILYRKKSNGLKITKKLPYWSNLLLTISTQYQKN